MARYPLYLARQQTSAVLQGRRQLAKHRNTILQSAQSIRFDGWSANNLLSALATRPRDRICCVSVDVEEDPDGRLNVPLADARLSLDRLIGTLDDDAHAGCFVFLHGPAAAWLGDAMAVPRARVQLVHVTHDPYDALFAFCCEFGLFWDLQSALYSEVDHRHLFGCGLALLTRLAESLGQTRLDLSMGAAPLSIAGKAWSDGRRFDVTADIEKFRGSARVEQLEDALKRIADSAAAPRLEHASVSERMVSTQGLFWLCELADRNDVVAWLADTRFFRELVPDAALRRPAPRLKLSPDRVEAVARRVHASMLGVPGGRYVVGSDDTSLESEPPAHKLTIELGSFGIMRAPFADRDWSDLTDRRSEHPERPVTDVSWFDCMDVAEALTGALQHLGLAVRLSLPTEYQWEVAARGAESTSYPWGDKWSIERCNCEMGVGHPTDCGRYSPDGDSAFGCADMAGNVREWTRSYAGTRGVDWQLHAQSRVVETVPIGANSRVVLRGGSYSYDRRCVQAWVRNTQIAGRYDRQTGFRLVAERLT